MKRWALATIITVIAFYLIMVLVWNLALAICPPHFTFRPDAVRIL